MSDLPYMKGVKALLSLRDTGALGRDTNANVVFQSFAGSCLKGSGQACHGCMSSPPMNSSDVEFIISGIQKKSNPNYTEEEGTLYLNWLMNNSMYARCFVTKDAEWCFKHEAIVVRPDIEANFLLSALQHTRRLWEFTWIPKVFTKFVEAGVIPELALYLAHNAQLSDRDKMCFGGYGSDHYPINSQHMRGRDLLAYMKGEPHKDTLNTLWSENPHYRGVQSMFLKSSDGTSVFKKHLSTFEIQEKVKTRVINPFMKAKRATQSDRKYYLIESVAEEVVKNLQPKILKEIGYAQDISG